LRFRREHRQRPSAPFASSLCYCHGKMLFLQTLHPRTTAVAHQIPSKAASFILHSIVVYVKTPSVPYHHLALP
jgi:hypothetical protein